MTKKKAGAGVTSPPLSAQESDLRWRRTCMAAPYPELCEGALFQPQFRVNIRLHSETCKTPVPILGHFLKQLVSKHAYGARGRA
mmetsp:Transcript_17369/g.41759  ORF Transcript_17369/g.41759 Transcript_17369/m.41759 type:complete len:84 (+) Transcript_17369:294-545(+)